MDLADLQRVHSMKIDGVLHLGAHLVEEARSYHRCRVGPVTWVEAQRDLADECARLLAKYPDQSVINACVSDGDGQEVTFHLANNGQSSSLLPLGTHLDVAPDVRYVAEITVTTTTVDTLADEWGFRANMVNADLQGGELAAFRGAEGFLAGVDYIYCELNWRPLYVGCGLLPDLDRFLGSLGFERFDTMMAGNSGWGDGLYARPEALGL